MQELHKSELEEFRNEAAWLKKEFYVSDKEI